MSKKNGQTKAKKNQQQPKATTGTTAPDAPANIDQTAPDTAETTGTPEHFSGLHKIPADRRKTDVVRIRKAALPPLVTIKTEDYTELVETLQAAGNDVEIDNGEHWFIIWTA